MSTVKSTSSTSSSALSSLSAKTGMAGLVSGLDTDSLVENLTSVTRAKIAKQEQSVTKSGWKQTSYRNVSKTLKEFQNKYLDILSSTNFRSEKLYSTVAASTTSTSVSATATSDANVGSITIDSITQLAANETIKGTNAVSKPLSTTLTTAGVDGFLADITAHGSKSMKLSLDGTVKTITFDAAFVTKATADGFQSAMQDKINTAFGYKTGTTPMIDVTYSSSSDKLSITATGSQLTVNALNSDTATLIALGFTDGQTDKASVKSTLGSLPLATGLTTGVDTFKLSINSVNFEFNKTDTLSSIMSKINAGNAGVTIGYSTISDKFTLTANNSGDGDNITIKETSGNLMTALGLTGAGATVTKGKNAILKINGIETSRSSNTVTVDGVKVELLKETTDPSVISLKTDTTSLKDTIKSFVTDYNNMIDMMNGLVTEKYDKNYQPLTDEQKSSMSETEIKQWETKAKTGLLAGDTTIRSITSKMQSLMYGSAVKGGITLFNMGITSAGYTENGKLKIDEEKLTAALETKGSAIKELFTTDKTGLANQLDSIIDGAVKTSGAKGSRGSLIEIAGYESTTSDKENNITTNITQTNKTIKDLKAKLKSQETYYWNKFSALETAMSSLNNQSSMLTSFSSGS